MNLDSLADKDKTIAILRHQYRRALVENTTLREEIALYQFEMEKIREAFNLSEEEYLDKIYGETINKARIK